MYEYKFIGLRDANLDSKTNVLNSFADQGWIVVSTNEDFTAALMEREKDSGDPSKPDSPMPIDAIRTPDHIRITDSVPVVSISTAIVEPRNYTIVSPDTPVTLTIEPNIEPSFLRGMDFDDMLARDRQRL
jgi:hypothetical protein